MSIINSTNNLREQRELIITLAICGHGIIELNMEMPKFNKDNQITFNENIQMLTTGVPGAETFFYEPNICEICPLSKNYCDPDTKCLKYPSERQLLDLLKELFSVYIAKSKEDDEELKISTTNTLDTFINVMKSETEKHLDKCFQKEFIDSKKRKISENQFENRHNYRNTVMSRFAFYKYIPIYNKKYAFYDYNKPLFESYFNGIFIINITTRVSYFDENSLIDFKYIKYSEEFTKKYKSFNLIYKQGILDYYDFIKEEFNILFPENYYKVEQRNNYLNALTVLRDKITNKNPSFRQYLLNNAAYNDLLFVYEKNDIKLAKLHYLYFVDICDRFALNIGFNKVNVIDFSCNSLKQKETERPIGTLRIVKDYYETKNLADEKANWGGKKTRKYHRNYNRNNRNNHNSAKTKRNKQRK